MRWMSDDLVVLSLEACHLLISSVIDYPVESLIVEIYYGWPQDI